MVGKREKNVLRRGRTDVDELPLEICGCIREVNLFLVLSLVKGISRIESVKTHLSEAARHTQM